MTRTLIIRKNSSPNYTFTITDADGSGLSITNGNFAIGMSISDGEKTWTVLPESIDNIAISNYINTNTDTSITIFKNEYCKRIANDIATKFMVTFPIELTQQITIGTEYSYEVFLLGFSGNVVYNIPIDSGSVNIVESYVPIKLV